MSGMKLIRCVAAICLLALGCKSAPHIPLPHRKAPVKNEVIFTGGILVAGPTPSPRPGRAVYVGAGPTQSPRPGLWIYVGGGTVRDVDDRSCLIKKQTVARVGDVACATIL